MKRIKDACAESHKDDIVVAIDTEELIQIVVDAAVVAGLIPEDRRYDPAFLEVVGRGSGSRRLTVMPVDTEIGGHKLKKRPVTEPRSPVK